MSFITAKTEAAGGVEAAAAVWRQRRCGERVGTRVRAGGGL